MKAGFILLIATITILGAFLVRVGLVDIGFWNPDQIRYKKLPFGFSLFIVVMGILIFGTGVASVIIILVSKK